MYYHGTDHVIEYLKPGRYISKYRKDAERFGYRNSIMNGSYMVYIYQVIVDNILELDTNRDGAFITNTRCDVVLDKSYKVYEVPHKLSNFKLK